MGLGAWIGARRQSQGASTRRLPVMLEQLEPRLLLSADLSIAGIAGPLLQQDDQPVLCVDLEAGSPSISMGVQSSSNLAERTAQATSERESENSIISTDNHD